MKADVPALFSAVIEVKPEVATLFPARVQAIVWLGQVIADVEQEKSAASPLFSAVMPLFSACAEQSVALFQVRTQTATLFPASLALFLAHTVLS